jgi:ankyrin repeat protein
VLEREASVSTLVFTWSGKWEKLCNSASMASPSQDDKEELLLSCRYGEIDEVQQYLSRFGSSSLSDVRDENGNCVLHMICGNGHLGDF